MVNLAELIKRHSACLTEKEIDYVKNFEWKTSELYMLPNVHKCKSILEAFEESQQLRDVISANCLKKS